jgi:hypothetical protein
MKRPVVIGYAGSPANLLVGKGSPWLNAHGTRLGAVHAPPPKEDVGYRITFVLNFKSGTPRSHADLLDLLWTLVRIDERYLLEHPETPLLYESGIRYEEEPLGEEDWVDIPSMLLRRRYLDCEDVACWRVAELRVRYGIAAEPYFTSKVKPDGGYLYHILVRYPDGRVEDPSRMLGMR